MPDKFRSGALYQIPKPTCSASQALTTSLSVSRMYKGCRFPIVANRSFAPHLSNVYPLRKGRLSSLFPRFPVTHHQPHKGDQDRWCVFQISQRDHRTRFASPGNDLLPYVLQDTNRYDPEGEPSPVVTGSLEAALDHQDRVHQVVDRVGDVVTVKYRNMGDFT